MIAHLSGRLLHKSTESVVIDTNGVGYEVFVPLSTFYEMPEEGSTVRLFVHTNVRDDAIHLYGFATPEEKTVFELLISVSGVGPKLARNILSGVGVPELVASIAEGDKARLSSIPGIGAKSAERLIVELREKAARLSFVPAGAPVAETDAVADDVVSALGNLGYKRPQAEEAVKTAAAGLAEPLAFEQLLKESLKCLTRR